MTDTLLDRTQYELFKLEVYGGPPLILNHIQQLHQERDRRLHEWAKQKLADSCYQSDDWTAYNQLKDME